MIAQLFEIQPSMAQTASAAGDAIDVSGFSELLVFLHLTAGSGTLSALDIYLESSDDGGATWYEICADTIFQSTGADGASPAATANARNLLRSTSIVTADTKVAAKYTVFGQKVRGRWLITPTSSPSETFGIKAVGKAA